MNEAGRESIFDFLYLGQIMIWTISIIPLIAAVILNDLYGTTPTQDIYGYYIARTAPQIIQMVWVSPGNVR